MQARKELVGESKSSQVGGREERIEWGWSECSIYMQEIFEEHISWIKEISGPGEHPFVNYMPIYLRRAKEEKKVAEGIEEKRRRGREREREEQARTLLIMFHSHS